MLGLSKAISRKRCKIGGKFVLITNRMSHVSFRLVPNLVTLDDLERRNNVQMAVTMRYFTEFGSFPGAFGKSS